MQTSKKIKPNSQVHHLTDTVSKSFHKGMHKLDDAQTAVKEYSHELWKKAHKKPVATALIVGGIGVLVGGVSLLVHSLFKRK